MRVGDGEDVDVVLGQGAAENARLHELATRRVRRQSLQVTLLVRVREGIIVG